MAKKKEGKKFARLQLADNAGDLWKSFSVIALALLSAVGAAGALWDGMRDHIGPWGYAVGVFVIGLVGLIGRYVKQPVVSDK